MWLRDIAMGNQCIVEGCYSSQPAKGQCLGMGDTNPGSKGVGDPPLTHPPPTCLCGDFTRNITSCFDRFTSVSALPEVESDNFCFG